MGSHHSSVNMMKALITLCFVTLFITDQVTTQNTNTKLFTGNQALDSGTLGFGLGLGAAALGGALSNNANSNPCGKRKRSAQNKDSRFFLGGGGSNCNDNNYPSNNYNTYPSNNYNIYPSNNYNTYPSNNYNTYPSNNYNPYPSNNYNTGSGCRCTSLSWTDHYGNVNGNCRSSDHGKGSWCYTTGWSSGCSDLHSSSRYPNNPWSYQACRNQWGK